MIFYLEASLLFAIYNAQRAKSLWSHTHITFTFLKSGFRTFFLSKNSHRRKSVCEKKITSSADSALENITIHGLRTPTEDINQ